MATDLNKTVLIGRLVKDAEINQTQSGFKVMRFTLAFSTAMKDANGNWTTDSHFIDCSMTGERCDRLVQYLVKGQQIGLEGHLRQEKWQDRQSGQARSKISIVVDNLQLIGGERKKEDAPQNQAQPVQQQSQQPQQVQQPAQQSSYSYDDDTIPF